MSNNGGMLDTYLIAQALGWEWNLQTMLTIDAILLGIGLLIVAFLFLLSAWLDS